MVRGEIVERACEIMHDAYEKAAAGAGWETNPASRKPWADVPEANKTTMRVAVGALLDWLDDGPSWADRAQANADKRCRVESVAVMTGAGGTDAQAARDSARAQLVVAQRSVWTIRRHLARQRRRAANPAALR